MKGSSKLVSLYYYNLIMIKDPNFKDKKSYSIYNNYLSEKQQVKIFNSLNFEDRIKLLDNCKISVRNLVFSQLSVEEKIDILFKVEYKDELLFTQTDNNLVLKMIEKVESFEEKLEIIKKSFKSPLFALKALELIPDSSERNDAINFILFKNEKAKISINELKDEKLISNIFLYNKVYGSVTHKQCEISFERDLNEFNDNVNRKIVVTESSSYVNLDETENTLLTEMKKNNFDVQKNVNPAILDKRYISTLGVDIVNVIACDRELQRQILSLNEKKYEIFCKMFNWYQEKYNLLDWKKLFYELINSKINSIELVNVMNEITDENLNNSIFMENFGIILSDHQNLFKINCVQDVLNYDKIVQSQTMSTEQHYNYIIEIGLEKMFGLNMYQVRNLTNEFGGDYESIESLELRELMKNLITVREVLQLDKLKKNKDASEEQKRAFIKFVDEFEFKHKFDFKVLHEKYRNEYAKLYNKQIFKVNTDLPQNEKGYYKVGNKFKMLVTVKGGANREDPTVSSNYQRDWYRPFLKSPDLCASLISEEMMGTISHNKDVTYIFSEVNDGDLSLASYEDIATSYGSDSFMGSALTSDVKYRNKFYSPQKQISLTSSLDGYNQVNLYRYKRKSIKEKEVKREPDGILAYMVDGKIINEDLIEKAKSDWAGKLNVFYIDVNEILLNQCEELRNMLGNYIRMPSSQKYDIIKNKIRTNRISVIKLLGYNNKFYNILNSLDNYLEEVTEKILTMDSDILTDNNIASIKR